MTVSKQKILKTTILGLACVALTANSTAGQQEEVRRDLESWRVATPEQPSVLLIRGATVWTQGPQGILENADLLVRDGKVRRVGEGLRPPSGAIEIDASGKHVTPGIIDAHSHSAVDGGVNEFGNTIVAEVSIRDVLDPRDINLYRQLAGGLTTAMVLHGSANPINGGNAIIKLRWGADPQGLLLEGAPAGIKFALGENPKQSNFGGGNRYPKSRSGVEEAIRERFDAALDYRRRVRQAEQEGRIPPRPDHQLDAIAQILDGSRKIHAHSYRADEILMLLELCDDYGVTIGTLQHVLEGYKVADEIAAHGAGASTFADWWGYKIEVVDAIPWNGALMHERGVLVSLNSDDDDLARRLNLDAAKAVRWGGLDPQSAFAFVTNNPAKQLGIDQWVGSLEEGKDADFVIWSADPLSTRAVVEQTWIDGRLYFDRQEDAAMRARLEAEKAELIAAVRATSGAGQEGDDAADDTGDQVEQDDEPAVKRFDQGRYRELRLQQLRRQRLHQQQLQQQIQRHHAQDDDSESAVVGWLESLAQRENGR